MKVSLGPCGQLQDEHPELHAAASAIIACIDGLGDHLDSVDGASVWLHHIEFARRAGALADHLAAALDLASAGRYASAYAVLRTCLEHSCLDELLLLADRYREFLKVDNNAFERLRVEYEAGTADWASSVVTFERTSKGISIVRKGHSVKSESGDVVEHLSPYYSVIDHHHAMLGPPSSQREISDAFSDPEELREWARRNRGLHERWLRWSAIVDNLLLNGMLDSRKSVQLEVHYRFLSAFTHATGTGYEMIDPDRGDPEFRRHPGHYLGELVLLYVCAVGVCELRAFFAFVDVRPKLLLKDRSRLERTCQSVARRTSYMWFPRVGAPTPYDHFTEANRRAFDGGRARPPFTGALRPEQIPAAELGYYRDPLQRLIALHQGGTEMTTGFYHRPVWC